MWLGLEEYQSNFANIRIRECLVEQIPNQIGHLNSNFIKRFLKIFQEGIDYRYQTLISRPQTVLWNLNSCHQILWIISNDCILYLFLGNSHVILDTREDCRFHKVAFVSNPLSPTFQLGPFLLPTFYQIQYLFQKLMVVLVVWIIDGCNWLSSVRMMLYSN